MPPHTECIQSPENLGDNLHFSVFFLFLLFLQVQYASSLQQLKGRRNETKEKVSLSLYAPA